jgi:predicted nuclease with TOPRIM domain
MTELLNSIDSQVQSEIKKGHQKKQVDKSSNIKQKQKVIDKGPHIFNKEESVVVAQLKDELEKKNDTIEKLKKNATKMEAEMNEVKVRNQVLCKMMSSGEFATKFKLLEEIEELTADKVDLTSEIERLNSELEQERSKSKSLQVENIKLQKFKKNASIVT